MLIAPGVTAAAIFPDLREVAGPPCQEEERGRKPALSGRCRLVAGLVQSSDGP